MEAILIPCRKSLGNILGLIQWIGMAVAIAYLIIMGIKFMQNGAANDQAEIKKNITPFLIGLVIILAVNIILRVISNLASKI